MTAVPVVPAASTGIVLEQDFGAFLAAVLASPGQLIPDVAAQAQAATDLCRQLDEEQKALNAEREALQVRVAAIDMRLGEIHGTTWGFGGGARNNARRQVDAWTRLRKFGGLPVIELLPRHGRQKEGAHGHIILTRLSGGNSGLVYYVPFRSNHTDPKPLCSMQELGDHVIPEHATKEAIAGYRKAIAARTTNTQEKKA